LLTTVPEEADDGDPTHRLAVIAAIAQIVLFLMILNSFQVEPRDRLDVMGVPY
jgi:hypothetical protein